MRLVFDRGTLLLLEPPQSLDAAALPGVLWDPRVAAYRAPAWRHPAIVPVLREQHIDFTDESSAREESAFPGLQGLRPPSLRPYQTGALIAWRSAGWRGVVALPTGSGKTRVGLAALVKLKTATLVLVPTRVLLHQWVEEVGRLLPGAVGIYGDGRRELAPVMVSTFESAYRHMSRWGNRFELLIVDEAHHFGCGSRDEILEMSLASARLGLTATPPEPGARADRLAELMGPTVFHLSVRDLAGRYLADFERMALFLELSPRERQAYDTEYRIFSAAFRQFRRVAPESSWADFMATASRTDEGLRALAAWRASRRITGFTRAKAAALRALLDRHREQRTLVFTPDNETAYRIAREHLIMPITCDIGRKERDRVLEKFKQGRLRSLVSSRVLNEGLDVPDAEVGILVGGTQGTREYVQRIGRVLRPTAGKRALVYELITRASTEERRARQREMDLDLPNRTTS
ncbi:MAG: DEAD/DEAH box helicase family protein [bacterium]